MATPAQRTNTWTLDEWYDQAVAGTTGGYNGVLGGWSWGLNSLGQLGQNNTTNQSSPIQITGSWERIQGNIGIKNDGTAWAWGYGQWGQPGQNNQTNYSSPMQIGTETTWSFIGMNPTQAYGLKTDGTLWSWGYNDGGDLGQGNRIKRSSPVQIPGTTWSTAYTAISVTAAGGSYAIKTDGTLWAWGSNNANLGQNFPANGHRSSPTQVGTDTTWRSIHGQQSAPGVRQAFATKTDGSMWSWGSGTGGGLGQGNNTPYNSPKQIGSGTSWNRTGFLSEWVGNATVLQ